MPGGPGGRANRACGLDEAGVQLDVYVRLSMGAGAKRNGVGRGAARRDETSQRREGPATATRGDGDEGDGMYIWPIGAGLLYILTVH